MPSIPQFVLNLGTVHHFVLPGQPLEDFSTIPENQLRAALQNLTDLSQGHANPSALMSRTQFHADSDGIFEDESADIHSLTSVSSSTEHIFSRPVSASKHSNHSASLSSQTSVDEASDSGVSVASSKLEQSQTHKKSKLLEKEVNLDQLDAAQEQRAQRPSTSWGGLVTRAARALTSMREVFNSLRNRHSAQTSRVSMSTEVAEKRPVTATAFLDTSTLTATPAANTLELSF